MVEPHEIWNVLLARASDPAAPPLTEDEQSALLTNIFVIEVENGGLNGALYNLSPTSGSTWVELRRTATAVDLVCAHHVGDSLRQVANVLEQAAVSLSGSTWSEFLKRVESEAFADLEEGVEAHVSVLWQELKTFTTERLCSRQ